MDDFVEISPDRQTYYVYAVAWRGRTQKYVYRRHALEDLADELAALMTDEQIVITVEAVDVDTYLPLLKAEDERRLSRTREGC